jgi:hypothetical protein
MRLPIRLPSARSTPRSLAGVAGHRDAVPLQPLRGRVPLSHGRRGGVCEPGTAIELPTRVARMTARKMFTKFHAAWVMMGGPAVLIVDLDANTCGGRYVPSIRLRSAPASANTSAMNATGRPPTSKHHASTVWGVLMDFPASPGWRDHPPRLGSVSDRPLVIGSAVERTVRTYGQAPRPVPDSHRPGPAGPPVLGGPGPSSIKRNNSS